MRTYSYMPPARRDARAEAKRAAAEAAGIPMRTDDDARQPIHIDLTCAGGDCLVVEPIRGRLLKWRARKMDTGEVIGRGALKTVLHALADKLPRACVGDS